MRSLTGQAATCARLKSYADFTARLAYGRKVKDNLVPSQEHIYIKCINVVKHMCPTRLPGYSAGQSRLVERDGALGLGNACLMRTSSVV